MLGEAAARIVRLYQVTVSRMLPQRCRFHPSCSQYAIDSLRLNGLLKGAAMALWRLARCGPWARGGYDPARAVGPAPLKVLLHAEGRHVTTHNG